MLKHSVYRYVVSIAVLSTAALAVEPGEPSKSSIMVGAYRAIGARNPNPQLRNPDYLAAKFIGPRELGILATADPPRDVFQKALAQPDWAGVLKLLPDADSPAGSTVGFTVRTRFFDSTLEEALHRGAAQIVILGAGFDSRGYRFKRLLQEARFFEVDFGPTQEYKKRRVQEALGELPSQIDYVPMDFTKDDLLTQLKKSGYSETAQTLFIWEGVSYYLPEEANRSTLRFVRDHAAPGSEIAFDYTNSGTRAMNNPDHYLARWGEPVVFGFPAAGAADFTRSEGLIVVSDIGWPQLLKRYAPAAGPAETTSMLGRRMILARVPRK
jgi:methyltransferase (TIGR00027 family)